MWLKRLPRARFAPPVWRFSAPLGKFRRAGAAALRPILFFFQSLRDLYPFHLNATLEVRLPAFHLQRHATFFPAVRFGTLPFFPNLTWYCLWILEAQFPPILFILGCRGPPQYCSSFPSRLFPFPRARRQIRPWTPRCPTSLICT